MTAPSVGRPVPAASRALPRPSAPFAPSDLRPELTTDYANILTLIYGADARPTSNAYPRMDELDARYRDIMNRLTRLLERPIVDGCRPRWAASSEHPGAKDGIDALPGPRRAGVR